MTRRVLPILLGVMVASGCGRISFDPLTADGGDPATADGGLTPRISQALGTRWSGTDARTFTESAAALGMPATDRDILVVIAGKGEGVKSAPTGFGVTIAGVAAQQVGVTMHAEVAPSFAVFGTVYKARVPDGTTGDIEVTFGPTGTTFFTFSMVWFAAYGGAVDAPSSVVTDDGAGPSDPAVALLDVQRGGLVVAAGAQHDSRFDEWMSFGSQGEPFGFGFQPTGGTSHFEAIGWHIPGEDWIDRGVDVTGVTVGHKILWVTYNP